MAGALLTTSTARPAGLTLRSAAGLVPAGPGLGVGAGVMTGKSPAAFPAPTTAVLTFTSGMGPGLAAAWMAPRRPAAPPGPMSELVAVSGVVVDPGDGTPPELAGLAVGAGLDDAGGVGLAEGAGLDDAEGVGLAVGVGDVEGAGLSLGVGVADAETVGLGVDVGGGDVEGAGLSLVLGAGVDGDGLGVPEALGSALVLAAAGDGGGDEATALANAGSCELADSPATRKPPVTRPATTARRRATDMWNPPLDDLLHPLTG